MDLNSIPILSIVAYIPLAGALAIVFLFPKEKTGPIKYFATLVAGLDFVVSLPLWFAFAFPPHAHAGPGGDRVEPGRDLRLAAKIFQPAIGIQEGFLHQVFGCFDFSAEAVSVPIDQIDMVSIQPIKLLSVVGRGGFFRLRLYRGAPH